MPNPKRRHSHARKNKRRAHDFLTPLSLGRMSQLPREKAAPQCVSPLRLLQGSGSD